MTLRTWSRLCAAFFALLVTAACRDRGRENDAARAPALATASDGAPSATEPAQSSTLPENPAAAARSVAQWRQHLEREERERRLGYDRRKLREHRAVLKRLRDARRSYDTAATKRAVLNAEQAFRAAVPELDARFDAIDHWGVSSKVLPDYRKLVVVFSDAYPAARVAALAGDGTPAERVGAEVDARFAAIDAWLGEAAESEDE